MTGAATLEIQAAPSSLYNRRPNQRMNPRTRCQALARLRSAQGCFLYPYAAQAASGDRLPAPPLLNTAKIETPACPTDEDGRAAFMNRRNSSRKRSPEQDPGGGRQTYRAIVGSMSSSDIQIAEHILFCHQSHWREPPAFEVQ